jgi:hypothetical protein
MKIKLEFALAVLLEIAGLTKNEHLVLYVCLGRREVFTKKPFYLIEVVDSFTLPKGFNCSGFMQS